MSESVRGDRRVVSVLVTDVVESTAIGERLGPERSKFLFDEIAALMETEVTRFGGVVVQHTGDGVLALFGAPVAHEDDSFRAVRAACALQEAFAAYARDVDDAYGVELKARVAVNTGPIAVSGGEGPVDAIYNALGETVTVAARLQVHAGPGGVVVGPLTARQVGARFELEPLGDLELKGKSELVVAFLVGREQSASSVPPGSALVGRDAEVETLERVFEELVAGHGAIVSITGEAGIGKSRLIAEFRDRHGDDVLFLEGSGVSYAEAIPYWPVREAFRGWLGAGVGEAEARTRLELKARLAATLGERAPAVQPFLALLLGVTPDRASEERLRDLGLDSVRRQTFDAVRELLVALAGERPVCLVLDDLHWADEATLELVAELLEAADEEAVLIALLYRSERELAAWRLGERARRLFPHRHTELQLRSLDPEASHSLAAGAAGGEIPFGVAELLAERSGGNPFFLEQALHDLVERGALRRENGGFVLAGDTELVVPSLVQEALQARLDRLAPDARELIGVAAVAGRTFGTALLERIAPELALAPLLADLQRLELVVEQRRRPVAEYRFRHGLVREVAYESLLEGRRRQLHQAAGDALEALHVEAPQEVYGLLAHHFSAADSAAQAGHYLVAAADHARAMYANDEAVDLYERSVPFLERAGDTQRARETLLKLGLAHHLAFDFVRANAAYAEAFSKARDPQVPQGVGERLDVATFSTRTNREGLVPGYCYEEGSGWVVAHLFRGLLRLDENLNIVPELAASFTVSPDGRLYRFELLPELRWGDGAPVTAGDFEYTWAKMREWGVESAFLLDIVKSAQAVEELTLEVELTEPRPYALYLFASLPFFPWPRHVVEELGRDWRFAPTLVGNGPYRLLELDNSHVLLGASPTWRGGRGNLEEVRIRLGLRLEETKQLWRAGRFDLGFERPLDTGDESTIVWTTRPLDVLFVGLCAGRPPLDDLRVRQAVAHALDLAELFREDPDRELDAIGAGLIPPSLPAHSTGIALSHDPARARELLAEAGFGGAISLPPLRLLSEWRDDPGHGLARAVEQWAEAGITVEVQYALGAEFDEAIEERAHLVRSAWAADYPDPAGILDSLLEGQPWIHRDDRLVELLARARRSRDADERWRIYREADRVLVQELVSVIPINHSKAVIVTRPWVEGVRFGPLHPPMFDELTIRRS